MSIHYIRFGLLDDVTRLFNDDRQAEIASRRLAELQKVLFSFCQRPTTMKYRLETRLAGNALHGARLRLASSRQPPGLYAIDAFFFFLILVAIHAVH